MSDEMKLTKYQAAVLGEIISAVGDPGATLESVAGHLGQVYEAAESRGDGDAMQLVSNAWTYVQMMSAQQGHALNLAAAARELAELAQQEVIRRDEELEEVRGEYDDLTRAIELGSEAHDLLVDYAQGIRDDAQSQMAEYAYEEALEQAYGDSDEQIDEQISVFCERRGIKMGYNARRMLVEKVRGEEAWDERQAGLWLQIIEIEAELQEQRDRERERLIQEWQEKREVAQRERDEKGKAS